MMVTELFLPVGSGRGRCRSRRSRRCPGVAVCVGAGAGGYSVLILAACFCWSLVLLRGAAGFAVGGGPVSGSGSPSSLSSSTALRMTDPMTLTGAALFYGGASMFLGAYDEEEEYKAGLPTSTSASASASAPPGSSKYSEAWSAYLGEVCDADDRSRSGDEACGEAIAAYADAVAAGTADPTEEAAAGIGTFLDSISSTSSTASNAANGAAAAAATTATGATGAAAAVTGYLDALSVGTVPVPTGRAVTTYLDSISTGLVVPPSTAASISSNLAGADADATAQATGLSPREVWELSKSASYEAAELRGREKRAGTYVPPPADMTPQQMREAAKRAAYEEAEARGREKRAAAGPEREAQLQALAAAATAAAQHQAHAPPASAEGGVPAAAAMAEAPVETAAAAAATVEAVEPTTHQKSSAKKMNGFSSYLDAISESCDANKPREECGAAISSYLDALSVETAAAAPAAGAAKAAAQPQPSTAAGAGFGSYLDSLNGNHGSGQSGHVAMETTSGSGSGGAASSAAAAAGSAMMNMNAEKRFNNDPGRGSNDVPPPPPPPPPPPTQEEEERYLKMVSNEVQYKKLLGQNPYSWTDIPLRVVLQRFLDNLEDSAQKNNGKIKGQAKLKGKKGPAEVRPTVVVLGTGWASHAFIKLASTYDLRIVVVSPVNHFVFTPMLASASVGTVEYRSMTEAIRVTNPFIDNFVEGRAIGVDVPNKTLKVQLTSLSTVTGAFKGIATTAPDRLDPDANAPVPTDAASSDTAIYDETRVDASRVIDLTYDYLVCAVGTSARSSIVPGAKEHCFNLKTSQDSKRLRTAIGEALEYASRPYVQEKYYPDARQQEEATRERQRRVRFVVVGGGPTGVELAGELSDFFAQVCGKPDGAFQHLAQDVSVILVHGGSELLPAMDQPLRQRALAALQDQGVEVRLNTRLKEVSRDFVKLGRKGSDDVETIPCSLTVWAAGNEPVPFVRELLSQLPESAAGSAGRINVDRWLRCPTPTPETFGSILILGDVACLEAESKYDPAASLPQTAQVAGQQGSFAARMLNRGYDLKETPPRLQEREPFDEFSLLRVWLLARGLEEAPEFTFLSLGLLAYVGGGEALNQVQLGDVPIFNYAGRVAFALWRSVYLAKQAATRNQALISFDWLRTEVFGRDITRL